jgi:hypothetical protein
MRTCVWSQVLILNFITKSISIFIIMDYYLPYSIEEIDGTKHIRFLNNNLITIMQIYFPDNNLFRNTVV